MSDENSAAVLNGLSAKIDEAGLTDAEQAVLDHVLARAASADASEVEGFMIVNTKGQAGLKRLLTPRARVWATAVQGRVILDSDWNEQR